MAKMATNKRMHNGGYDRDVEEGTELGVVQNAVPSSSHKKGTDLAVGRNPVPSSSTRKSSNTSLKPSKLVCRTEICRSAKNTYLPPNLTSSPWNKFKAVSFLVLIVLFIIWIVVYSVLRHLKIV